MSLQVWFDWTFASPQQAPRHTSDPTWNEFYRLSGQHSLPKEELKKSISVSIIACELLTEADDVGELMFQMLVGLTYKQRRAVVIDAILRKKSVSRDGVCVRNGFASISRLNSVSNPRAYRSRRDRRGCRSVYNQFWAKGEEHILTLMSPSAHLRGSRKGSLKPARRKSWAAKKILQYWPCLSRKQNLA